MSTAQFIVFALYAYLGVGVLVGPAFVFVGANRWIAGARESGFVFRLFVLPGAVLLWPFILASIGRLRREAP